MLQNISPKLGDLKKTTGSTWVWHACIGCGKERWVKLLKGVPKNPRCRSCSPHSPTRKQARDRYKDHNGYIRVHLSPDDFFYPMTDTHGYVYEHRLVMAKILQRCLLPWDVVHHKQSPKDNNAPDNLRLLPSQKYHVVDSILKTRINRLESILADQQEQIHLLTWRIKELEQVGKEVSHG